jgi:hypothetical protein
MPVWMSKYPKFYANSKSAGKFKKQCTEKKISQKTFFQTKMSQVPIKRFFTVHFFKIVPSDLKSALCSICNYYKNVLTYCISRRKKCFSVRRLFIFLSQENTKSVIQRLQIGNKYYPTRYPKYLNEI